MHSKLKDLMEKYYIPSEGSVIARSPEDEYFMVKYEISFEDFLQSVTDRHISVLLNNNIDLIERLLPSWGKHYITVISVENPKDETLLSKSPLNNDWMYIEEDDTDYDNIYSDYYPKLTESELYDEDYFGIEEDEEDW